jgi:hypothetical protein
VRERPGRRGSAISRAARGAERGVGGRRDSLCYLCTGLSLSRERPALERELFYQSLSLFLMRLCATLQLLSKLEREREREPRSSWARNVLLVRGARSLVLLKSGNARSYAAPVHCAHLPLLLGSAQQ